VRERGKSLNFLRYLRYAKSRRERVCVMSGDKVKDYKGHAADESVIRARQA
jgi:hypothetical protein